MRTAPTFAPSTPRHGADAVLASGAPYVRRPRVVLVGRHYLISEAVGRSLPRCFHAVPVALPAFASTGELRSAVLRARPAVVILLVHPGGALDPLSLVEALAHHVPVVVIGDLLAGETEGDYLASGARRVFARPPQVRDLIDAVEGALAAPHAEEPVSAPRPRTPAGAGGGESDAVDQRRTRRNLAALTPAESRILGGLLAGRSAEEIARANVVSVRTVRTQIRDVLRKLEVRSQLAAVAVARQAEWRPHASSCE